MDHEDQLRRYFGTAQLSGVGSPALEAGIERMKVDLGLEKERGRCFALSLLHRLGAAQHLDAGFSEERDRAAARQFMELAERAGEGAPD